MACGLGDGIGEAGEASLVMGVPCNGEGVSGESLAAPEQAAVRMIDAERTDTARIKTRMSITWLKLCHGFRRKRHPDLMLIHWLMRPSQSRWRRPRKPILLVENLERVPPRWRDLASPSLESVKQDCNAVPILWLHKPSESPGARMVPGGIPSWAPSGTGWGSRNFHFPIYYMVRGSTHTHTVSQPQPRM